MFHKWNNLKNNRDNKARYRELFNTYIDEVIVIALTLAMIYISFDIYDILKDR